LKVAGVIRETRPRVIILPYWKGRHPDHYTASVLGYEACFLAGLAKLDPQTGLSARSSATIESDRLHRDSEQSAVDDGVRAGAPQDSRREAGATPHRPFKIIYATLYYDVRPTFVVDISEQFEGKFASILAYKSQFTDQNAGKDLFPAHDEIHVRVEAMARFYGMLGGVTFAEPFLQKEVGLVDDLLSIPVKSI
jgi:LmbE family N-acetylglucosaminyl deacetylase